MSSWRSESSSDGMPLFVHIAAGVFIGIVAAVFVIWRLWVWQTEAALAEAAAALKQANASMVQQRRQAEEAAARQEQAKRTQAATAQRADEAARQQALEEIARREAAWANFYRKSAACDEARGGSWTVDCANDFMRAKKRFAELYDAGKL